MGLGKISCGLVTALVAVVFTASPSCAEDQTFRVTGVDIVGTQRIDTAALREQIKVTAGTVGTAALQADIKALYQTGFFDQVQASVVSSGGKDVLRYTVVEKPVVRKVFIVGNKGLDQDDLGPVLQFSGNRFLDAAKIKAVIRNAVTLYQGRGYFDAAISHSVVPVGDNQVDVTFTVTEGDKYKIRQITFEGLKAIDESDLVEVMQTREYSFWKSWLVGTGRLNTEMIEADKAALRQYFLDTGYVDGSVGDPRVEKVDGALNLTFVVSEGPRYSIGNVSVEGDLLEAGPEATIDGVASKSGDFFSATKIREDAFRISEKFADIGFAYANVVPDTRMQNGTSLVDIVFVVQKGDPVAVDQINIRGNDKTYDNVIRRELVIGEQEIYSGAKVKRSERLLKRLGLFEEVSITNEPTQDPKKVDLLVNVREASTGSFSAGAGYSTADGALINAKLSENNLFGTGRSASINIDMGTENDSVSVSLEDRRFLDTYYQLGIDAVKTEREFRDFDREQTGGGITVGYPVEQIIGEAGQDMQLSIDYQYLDIKIDNIDEDAATFVKNSAGASSASAVTPKLVRNTIDNPLNPTKGSRQQISVELAGLGGSEKYFLAEIRNAWYYPLIQREWGDIVFGWRFRFGYGDSFDSDPLPLFRRYFPGGINTVRGFEERSLGPRDGEDNEYGGAKQLINNFEVVFPLVQSAGLRGLFFYDHGEAFDDGESVDLSALRHSAGYGVRWSSPLGPIRIEVGYPLDREPGEDAVVTLFSFGAPF